jgi:hypothetical protein
MKQGGAEDVWEKRTVCRTLLSSQAPTQTVRYSSVRIYSDEKQTTMELGVASVHF